MGKSTLFNRLVRSNKAITHDRPGVTRDRIYGEVCVEEGKFALVDTGGLIPESSDEIEEEIFARTSEAIEEADLVLFVVNGRDGCTSMDENLARMLRQSNRPVLLVVNKVDGYEQEGRMSPDFFPLGFDPLCVSAEHGYNISSLLDSARKILPISSSSPAEEDSGLKISILGRPNVGKSSLINALAGENRQIVDSKGGTTRDSVDVTLQKNNRLYTFVDTAGVRKKSRVRDSLERFSVLRALKSSIRSEVAFIVMDALDGLLFQDKKLLSFLSKESVPFVVIINKVDQVERSELTRMKKYFREELRFFPFVPIVYTSAVTKAGLGGLLPLAEKLWNQCQKRVTTGELNRFLQEVTSRHQPPVIKGKRAKFYYLTQPETGPPEFVFFVNNNSLIKTSYSRYLEKQIRKSFGLDMTPIKMYYRNRSSK